MARTAKEIYEAAEETIFQIVSGGTASASFNGRSYTAANLTELRGISDFYRNLAIERGELEDDKTPTVSYVTITEQVPTC